MMDFLTRFDGFDGFEAKKRLESCFRSREMLIRKVMSNLSNPSKNKRSDIEAKGVAKL